MGSLLMNRLHMVWQILTRVKYITLHGLLHIVTMVTHIYSLVTITLVHSNGKCVVLLQYILEPPPMTSAIIDRRAADSDRYIKLEPEEMCHEHIPFHIHCTVDLNHHSVSNQWRGSDPPQLLADARWIETHCYVDSRNRPNPILTYFSHMNIQYVSLLLFDCSFRLPRRRL